MLGISMLDWFVLMVYFVGITALGLWTYRKIKSSADFFMGNSTGSYSTTTEGTTLFTMFLWCPFTEISFI